MDEQQKRLAEELFFAGKKKPTFAGLLYFGVFDPSYTFPFPRISEEEKKVVDEFLEKVNQFAEEAIDPDWIDRHAQIPDHVIEGLARLGVLGMTIPKEYGGLGMSQYAYCRTCELLAKHCASTALLVNASQSIGLKSILLFGSEEQRQKWLPPLARGEQIAAFSLTEPNAGSDASGIETRATYDSEKNVYVLNGRKQWTTSGSIAKVLTVMAQTSVETEQGKQDKVTAFIVTPDRPGFKILNPALEKVGMRGTRTANLEFVNLEVPVENILGSLGGGLRVCLTALDYGRTTFGAMCTGIAKDLLARAIYQAKTRYQFKRPLASFDLVKKKIAEMSALTYAMDATTYLTAALIDGKAEDVMIESAMLKVFASDSLWSIIYDTMQIYGGRSFFSDAPFERMMRDARLNMIGEGANEVLRAFIGGVGMRDVGVQLKKVLDALSHPIKERSFLKSFFENSLKRYFFKPSIPVRSSLLSNEAKHLGSAIRRFSFAIIQVLARYRENIAEKELILDRIATSAMAIYTMTAVLSKLDADLAVVNDQAEKLGNDLASGKFYCQMAMKQFNFALQHLFDKNDQAIQSLSDQVTGVGFQT